MTHAITSEKLDALSTAIENLEAETNCCFFSEDYGFHPEFVQTALDNWRVYKVEDPAVFLEVFCLKPASEIAKRFQSLKTCEENIRRMVVDIAEADKREADNRIMTPFDTLVSPFLEEIKRFVHLCEDCNIHNPFEDREMCPVTLRGSRENDKIFKLGKLLEDHLSSAKVACEIMAGINKCVEDVQKALMILEEGSDPK